MERISSYMWSVLDRHIGFEGLVNLRRRIHYFHNKTFNCHNSPYCYNISGSRGEGFTFTDSDIDWMIINTYTIVVPRIYFEESRLRESSNFVLIMETDNLKPGFARLRVPSQERWRDLMAVSALTHMDGRMYISSQLFRDSWVKSANDQIYFNYQGHGPCFTNVLPSHLPSKKIETDNLVCYSCPFWPEEASDWVNRNHPNNWPSVTLVNDIVDEGVLLVLIGNPLSPNSHIEWRISFSMAEKKLVYSMNHTQFLCYGLLKLFLKHVIDSNVSTKGLLCSYFMKTVLFSVIEQEIIEWNRNTLCDCFWICIKRLYAWVRRGFCPNYFINSNNMFEHKINADSQRNLSCFLSQLYENRLATLEKIPLFTNLHILGISNNMPLIILITPLEMEMRCFIECVHLSCYRNAQTRKEDVLRNVRLFRTETETCQYDHDIIYVIKCGLNYYLSQYLYHHITCLVPGLSNKDRYRYLIKLKNHILRNSKRGDMCTGWIQYATFCYLTGRYTECVLVLEYALAKLKPHTYIVGYYYPPTAAMPMAMNVCGRGLSFSAKLKSKTVFDQHLLPQCGFYPPEIHDIMKTRAEFFTSLTSPFYIRVLLFFSYRRLGWKNGAVCSLSDLSDMLKSGSVTAPYHSLSLAIVNRCMHIPEM